jgi:hypothetical protein
MRRREDVAFGSMLLNNFAAGSVCSLSRRERSHTHTEIIVP